MAVAERSPFVVQILLESGADPDLRTRIDERGTPIEMAQAAGLNDIATLLAGRGAAASSTDAIGTHAPRGHTRRRRTSAPPANYRVRLRLWVNAGEAVRWQAAWGTAGVASLEDDGKTLITEVRIDRRSLINGLFYGVDGMHVGGMRRLEIAPHLGYGDRGVPGVIPARAVLTAEITILEASASTP
jgi:hypothetical protein